jgi:hypothetical protein
MSAAVTAPQPERPGFARIRDDLIAAYKPANAHEHMLAVMIAHAVVRLERAYDLEQRYAESHDLFDVLDSKPDQFRALTRYVTDCERGWRHAVELLERTQRRRQAAEHPPAKARTTPPRPKATPGSLARHTAPVAEITPSRRE